MVVNLFVSLTYRDEAIQEEKYEIETACLETVFSEWDHLFSCVDLSFFLPPSPFFSFGKGETSACFDPCSIVRIINMAEKQTTDNVDLRLWDKRQCMHLRPVLYKQQCNFNIGQGLGVLIV